MNALRIATVLVFAGAVLIGCDRAPQPSAARAAAETPKSSVLAESARFMEWLRTDRAAVVHQIALKEYALQSRLLEFSGLTEELGGPERANSALRDLMVAVEASGTPPDAAQWTRIDSGSEVSGAFNVAQATVEIAGVALDFGRSYGEGDASRTGSKTDTGTGEIEVGNGSIEYTSAKDVTASGLNGKFALRMKVNVCPDAAGEILLEITGKAAISSSKSGRGANTDFKATAKRTVDDDANMSGLEVTANLQSAEFGGGSGMFIDMNADMSTTRGVMGTRVNRRSAKATDADVATTESLLLTIRLMAIAATELTRSVWENGKCVKINTQTTPGQREGAKPSTSFSLYAGPRSKLDGSFVGGTVRATLQGGASVDPANTKVRADGNFNYIAPDKRNQKAAVMLESRSKRGIAKEDVSFSTAGDAFTIDGGAAGFHGKGLICDLTQTFYVEGDGVGVRFEPSSRTGGSYTYSGTMTGDDNGKKMSFKVHGKGTYKVTFADDVPVNILAEGPGTVETPFGPQDGEGKEVYVLRPTPDAACEEGT